MTSGEEIPSEVGPPDIASPAENDPFLEPNAVVQSAPEPMAPTTTYRPDNAVPLSPDRTGTEGFSPTPVEPAPAPVPAPPVTPAPASPATDTVVPPPADDPVEQAPEQTSTPEVPTSTESPTSPSAESSPAAPTPPDSPAPPVEGATPDGSTEAPQRSTEAGIDPQSTSLPWPLAQAHAWLDR